MKKEIKLEKNSRSCPKCKSSWDGGSILETFIQQRNEGAKVWQGKSDEEIKRDIEGWPEEEVLAYIDGIKEFNLDALARRGYKTGNPKEFLLTLEKWNRNLYLSLVHEVSVGGYYAPPYRWGRQIGIELPYDHPQHYDGVSYIQCPDCKTTFNRFTGKEEEIPDYKPN